MRKTHGLSRWWMAACCFVVLAASVPMAWAQAPIERLSVPGPIRFSGADYRLAWSSHPYPAFYKQEYLPRGEQVERYENMLMIDVITGPTKPLALATAKVQELEARKPNDPVVNHQLLANEAGDQVILDFLLSAPGADGQIIVEWNAYRYITHGDGVAVLAISRRAYGDDVPAFLKEKLRDYRDRDIAALAAMALPDIRIVAD